MNEQKFTQRQQQELAKFGEFFGSDLDREQYGLLAFWRLHYANEAIIAEQERKLTNGRWFDYRFMSPTMATFLFAKAYKDIYKRVYRRHFDVERGEFVRGISNENIFMGEQRVLTGLWRARQHADALCMPYELYIEFAIEKLMRIRRDFIPRPEQLYSDRAVMGASNAWNERHNSVLYIAKDERYRNHFYDGLRAQDDHRTWVLDHLARQANPSHAAAQFLWKDPILTEELIVARLGAETLERARQYAAG